MQGMQLCQDWAGGAAAAAPCLPTPCLLACPPATVLPCSGHQEWEPEAAAGWSGRDCHGHRDCPGVARDPSPASTAPLGWDAGGTACMPPLLPPVIFLQPLHLCNPN